MPDNYSQYLLKVASNKSKENKGSSTIPLSPFPAGKQTLMFDPKKKRLEVS